MKARQAPKRGRSPGRPLEWTSRNTPRSRDFLAWGTAWDKRYFAHPKLQLTHAVMGTFRFSDPNAIRKRRGGGRRLVQVLKLRPWSR
jgi:hypothetical protein